MAASSSGIEYSNSSRVRPEAWPLHGQEGALARDPHPDHALLGRRQIALAIEDAGSRRLPRLFAHEIFAFDLARHLPLSCGHTARVILTTASPRRAKVRLHYPPGNLASVKFWSGRRDSNPRPQPWQGCALPLSYTRIRRRVVAAGALSRRATSSYAKDLNALQPRRPAALEDSPPCPPRLTSFSPIWTASASPTRPCTHPPVFTVEEARALRGKIPGGHTKNLFLRDKKGALYLVVAPEDAAIELDRCIGCLAPPGASRSARPN